MNVKKECLVATMRVGTSFIILLLAQASVSIAGAMTPVMLPFHIYDESEPQSQDPSHIIGEVIASEFSRHVPALSNNLRAELNVMRNDITHHFDSLKHYMDNKLDRMQRDAPSSIGYEDTSSLGEVSEARFSSSHTNAASIRHNLAMAELRRLSADLTRTLNEQVSKLREELRSNLDHLKQQVQNSTENMAERLQEEFTAKADESTTMLKKVFFLTRNQMAMIQSQLGNITTALQEEPERTKAEAESFTHTIIDTTTTTTVQTPTITQTPTVTTTQTSTTQIPTITTPQFSTTQAPTATTTQAPTVTTTQTSTSTEMPVSTQTTTTQSPTMTQTPTTAQTRTTTETPILTTSTIPPTTSTATSTSTEWMLQEKVFPRDCEDALKGGQQSGVTRIRPAADMEPKKVWCEQELDGGGWTVMLRRWHQPTQLDFRRSWESYSTGFGDPNGEYWIVTESDLINEMRKNFTELLRLSKNLIYNSVGPSNYYKHGYELNVGGYNESSTAGDAMEYHNGMDFSTYDGDNDSATGGSCSEWSGGGGWWFNYCYYSNPTGIYPPADLPDNTKVDHLLEWRKWQGYHTYLSSLIMMIRPN
nr:angiopoietin-2-like [Cherax quadricarinatus]